MEYPLGDIDVPKKLTKRRYGRKMNVKKAKAWKQIPYRFGK